MQISKFCLSLSFNKSMTKNEFVIIRRAQVKVGLISLCKGLFNLNAHIYYKLKSGT
jgi:hypothetical protein